MFSNPQLILCHYLDSSKIMTTELDHLCLLQSVNERPEPISAEIKGNLPLWLAGTLLRNGPGRFECGDTSFKHWFDGKGLLHGFHIQDGHVTYNNKFVQSQGYADSLEHSKSHLEFGTFVPPDPCQNIFARFFSQFWADEVPFDNAMDTIFAMKDKMYAASDTNFIFEIDPKTLDTLKTVDFTKEFPGNHDNKACMRDYLQAFWGTPIFMYQLK